MMRSRSTEEPHVTEQPPQEPPANPSDAWKPPAGGTDAAKVQDQVQRQAGVGPVAGGGGTLFTEPVLVVNQKMKLIELVTEYKVFDQHGTEIGSVAQVGQSALKKAARFVSQLDQFMTHTYEIRDQQGQPVLVLTRPRKFMKSKFAITRPDGSAVGDVAQKNMMGKIRFSLSANGQELGTLNAENWRAWNFNIKDAGGTEIARINKTWEGLAKTMFTTADNYVVQFHQPLEDPLRSLVVAAALCVDTALKQDSRGLT
ncbi:MAG: LURP-one-related/scramblase family protein [Actinomycetota bacterium]